MTLDEMTKIADARTKAANSRYWNYNFETKQAFSQRAKEGGNDAEFIAMAANNWDKLMAVVDAAKRLGHALGDDFMDQQVAILNALKALEQE